MTTTAAIISLAATGTGATTLAIAEAVDASNWGTGIIAVVVGGVMIPVFRWIATSLDARQKAEVEAAAKREDREERRVVALQQVATDLQLLTTQQTAAAARTEAGVTAVKNSLEKVPAEVVRVLVEQGVIPKGPR